MCAEEKGTERSTFGVAITIDAAKRSECSELFTEDIEEVVKEI